MATAKYRDADGSYKPLFGGLSAANYPVGSVYISAADTSPAELFGGTWEQIKDKFLLGTGDSYAAGSTGGEAEHTLTLEEMPSHAHSTNIHITSGAPPQINSGASNGYYTIATLSNGGLPYAGGSQPHNNLPPYLAVYIWRRIS